MKPEHFNGRKTMASVRLLAGLASLFLVPLLVLAVPPAWWNEQQVLDAGSAPNDYAALNQGQLKNLAKKAHAAMLVKLPTNVWSTTQGTTLTAFVNSLTNSSSNYNAVNLGQLKNTAKKFYDVLMLPNVGVATNYPWTGAGAPNDYAMANIGQAKNLFSFDLTHVIGGPITEEWWQQYFGNTPIDAEGDSDGDDLTNQEEYWNGTNPTDYYNGVTPLLQKMEGDNQTAEANTFAALPISVLISDGSGHCLANASLFFSVSQGSGQLAAVKNATALTTSANVRSDGTGWASFYVKLPPTGSTSITVSAPGTQATTVSFTLAAHSGAVATPILLADANYSSASRTITISCTTIGTDIRYTVNGNMPTLSSSTVVNGGTIAINGRTLVRAKAFKSGYIPSQEASALYAPFSINSKVAAGSDGFSFTVSSNGNVWAWGNNGYGQLGLGTTTYWNAPKLVSSLTNIISVSAATQHAAAVGNDGKLWIWGKNDYGQLGNGTQTSTRTPIQVPGLTNIIAVACGGYRTFAIKNDHTVLAWGAEPTGDGTTASRSSPVTIGAGSLSNVTSVTAGYYVTAALKADGTVWAWGVNTGTGTADYRSSPVQVTSLSGILAIAAGNYHTLALKSNGTVWGWGYNTWGNLADGTQTQRDVPVQVLKAASTPLTGVVAIAAGTDHSLAITNDGKLYAWGKDVEGQLGDGSPSDRRLYATEITSLSGYVSAIAGGNNHSLLIKSDNTIWAMGEGESGQLGNGENVIYRSPVKVKFEFDSDGDGLSDDYELVHAMDPLGVDSNGDSLSDGKSVELGIDPVQTDLDGDNITNNAELLLGTDPFTSDTDGDGTPDGLDVAPLDPAMGPAPGADPNDHTPPTILLSRPASAQQIQ